MNCYAGPASAVWMHSTERMSGKAMPRVRKQIALVA